MELAGEAESVVVRLTHDEAMRLRVAIIAGYEAVSRAEYFIRTGLSEPAVRRVADALSEIARDGFGARVIPLEPGVEEIENPRRPRPRS
jgi:hypothetical protein